jgi:hypothetical protein
MSLISSNTQACIPKIKYFGISNEILDKENPFIYDRNGKVTTLIFRDDLFESDKPPISIVDSSIWHYDSSKKSYTPFDKNLYKNIDYDFYQENFNDKTITPLYSISIKQYDETMPAIFSDKTINKEFDYKIKIDRDINNEIQISKFKLTEDFSNFYNNSIYALDKDQMFVNSSNIPKDISCAHSLYYFIPQKYVSDIKSNKNSQSIHSIEISSCLDIDSKPDLTLNNGVVQYLDLDLNIYQNFNSNSYENVKANAYNLETLFNKNNIFLSQKYGNAPYYLLKITQEDCSKEMKFGNLNIQPVKSYDLKSISDDGTSSIMTEIQNNFQIFLN